MGFHFNASLYAWLRLVDKRPETGDQADNISPAEEEILECPGDGIQWLWLCDNLASVGITRERINLRPGQGCLPSKIWDIL